MRFPALEPKAEEVIPDGPDPLVRELDTVLILINALEGGGSEKQAVLAATGLAGKGLHCAVYWLQDRRPQARMRTLMQNAQAAGVCFHPPRAGAKFDLAQVFRLRTRLRADSAAVLWTWGSRADLAALLLYGLTRGLLIVGSLRSANQLRIRQYRHFWRLLGRTHTAFISNSALNIRQIATVAPRVALNSAIIYNAVESAYFRPRSAGAPAHPCRVVMLGNQNSQIKGYDIAVEMAGLIKKRGLAIRLTIGGAPSDRHALAATIAGQGLGEILELHGEVADPVGFLSGADIFLMLSRFEGTPNALLEAMALGLPAVCTPIGDVPLFAQDRVHLRLVPGNAEAALAALIELLADWPAAQAMARSGNALCRDTFSEGLMIDKTFRLLRDLRTTRGFLPSANGGKP